MTFCPSWRKTLTSVVGCHWRPNRLPQLLCFFNESIRWLPLVTGLFLCCRFPEDAYRSQPFLHPDRCLRRCPGPHPVRLPALHIQATQQCIARETLLAVCVGVCAEWKQRKTQHTGEDIQETSQIAKMMGSQPELLSGCVQAYRYICTNRPMLALGDPAQSRTFEDLTAPLKLVSRPTSV